MTPGILMLIGLGSAIVGILGLVLNFFLFVKNMGSLNTGSLGLRFAAHVLCGILYGGGAVAILAGFIWFLVTLIVGAPAPTPAA